jgi:hypothetical protein
MDTVRTAFDVPGVTEVLVKASLIRAATYLLDTERIGPFVVRSMSFADYLALRISGSPLLPDARGEYPHACTPAHLAAFLWRLQPDYAPGEPPQRRDFMRRCHQLFFRPEKPLLRTRRAMRRWTLRAADSIVRCSQLEALAREYVDDTLIDRPEPRPASGEIDYYGDGCALASRFGRSYGWSKADTLAMPMKQVFQHLQECSEHDQIVAGIKPVMSGPQDRFVDKYLESVNSRN